MRVKSYSEAVRLARCAGADAANRRMRKAGRTAWSAADHDHAARVTKVILSDLGFDIAGWLAMAGAPRNKPDYQQSKKSPRRRAKSAPVQLSFGFA